MSTSDFPGPLYGQYGDDQPLIHQRTDPWRTVIPMHPLSVGETLDAAMRLLRFNPGPFIVFPIVVNLVVSAIDVLLALALGQSLSFDPGDVNNVYIFLSLFITFVANLLVIVAGTRVTLASVRGQKLSLSQTFTLAKDGLGRIGLRMLGFALIAVVAITVAIFIFAIGFSTVIFAAFGSDSGAGFLIANLIVLVVAYIAFLFFAFYRFTVAPPAMVAEDLGPFEGLARSWRLTKGSLGYFLGMFVSLAIISIVLTTILGIVFTLTASTAFDPVTGSVSATMGTLGSIIFSLLMSALLVPISMAIINLIYVNMRMKRENFHQEFLYGAGAATQMGAGQVGGNAFDQGGYGQQAGYPQPGYGQNAFDQSYGQYGQYGQTGGNGYDQNGQYGQTGGYNQYGQTGGYNQTGDANGTQQSNPEGWDGRPQWYGDTEK